MKGAARVPIILPMLQHVLRLPKGQEIIAVETTMAGDLVLTVEGDGLPPRQAGRAPQLQLIFWMSDNGRTVHLGWQHETADPSKRWLLRSDPPTTESEPPP